MDYSRYFHKNGVHLPVEQGTVCLKLGMPRAVVWAFGGGRGWLRSGKRGTAEPTK